MAHRTGAWAFDVPRGVKVDVVGKFAIVLAVVVGGPILSVVLRGDGKPTVPKAGLDVPTPTFADVVPAGGSPVSGCLLQPGQHVTWVGTDPRFGALLSLDEPFGGSDCPGGVKVFVSPGRADVGTWPAKGSLAPAWDALAASMAGAARRLSTDPR